MHRWYMSTTQLCIGHISAHNRQALGVMTSAVHALQRFDQQGALLCKIDMSVNYVSTGIEGYGSLYESQSSPPLYSGVSKCHAHNAILNTQSADDLCAVHPDGYLFCDFTHIC